MSLTNCKVAGRFREQRTGRGGNVFSDGKRFLSYSACIALHVACQGKDQIILDGTHYSSTTSQHQAEVRQSLDPTTSFPVLQEAGLMEGSGFRNGHRCGLLPGVKVLAADRDYFETVIVDKGAPIPFKVPMGATVIRSALDTAGKRERVSAHRPGGILLHRGTRLILADCCRLPYTYQTWAEQPEYDRDTDRRFYQVTADELCDEYFLAAMDDRSYFVSQLPHAVATIAEAFDSLKPQEIHIAEHYDVPVVRQGEWYFVPVPVKEVGAMPDEHGPLLFPRWTSFAGWEKSTRHVLAEKRVLPRPTDSSNPHTATRYFEIAGQHFVSGTVRHPEHRMVKLPKGQVFQAYRNLSQGDWSAGRLGLGVD